MIYLAGIDNIYDLKDCLNTLGIHDEVIKHLPKFSSSKPRVMKGIYSYDDDVALIDNDCLLESDRFKIVMRCRLCGEISCSHVIVRNLH